MFRSLKTKLTVLYASLFGAILLVASLVTYAAVTNDALRTGRRELSASSVVFDRVWALKTQQLRSSAGLLSRDFGFREALATHDAATISSAVDNLKQRLGIDAAAVIGDDDAMSGEDAQLLSKLTPGARRVIETDDGATGVAMLGGQPYEVVAVPIRAPVTMGWVVFAARLDRAEMRSLEQLASVPLTASIVRASRGGADETSRFVAREITGNRHEVRRLDTPQGAAMALVKPLHALDPADPAALLLTYPVAQALAPYGALFALLFLTALAGLAALIIGARILARNIVRPIAALEEAAFRMEGGELSQVEVTTFDETGRLAIAFNRMVATIGQRDAEKARVAEALARARDEAEAANRAKSSFLANMSHEVRTPLNGVLGLADVLAGSGLEPEQQEMVGRIQQSAEGLQRVLTDVLDLARIEAGHMQIVEEQFDLEEALNPLVQAAQAQARARGLGFRYLLDRKAQGRVRGDRIRLQQILNNLLSNALKFTPAGEATLAVSVEGDTLVFEVRDTGVGFDPAMTEELFRPFRQADESHSRGFGGTGLGLSISRELARAMGGDLTATAKPGEGATFTAVTPLVRVAPAATAESEAADPNADADASSDEQDPSEGLRILIVDDHETNRMVVRLMLQTIGAETVEAENGAKGVEAFETGVFNLVLMDMQMPVMDGITAIRAIRALESERGASPTPILVLSANALSEHIQTSLDAGADGHLAKPITAPKLMAAVGDAVRTASEAAPERKRA